MKVLVVSDTHGLDDRLEQAVELERPFDMLIHCGDVEGREDYIEALADCPCCIVAGNNDFFSGLPGDEEICLGGKKYLVTHGHYYGVSMEFNGLANEARSRGCAGVFFGHIHRPVFEEKNGVLIINPGSLTYPRQRGRRPSYIVLDVEEDGSLAGEIRYL